MCRTDAEFEKVSCLPLALLFLFRPPFLEFTHSHRHHDGRRYERVHAKSTTSVARSHCSCCLHATRSVEHEQHSPLSSRSALRPVQLQLCRSSPVPRLAVKKPKHRPFRGGRREPCRCIPVLVPSLTSNRALPRGHNLDNIIEIPLTPTVLNHPSAPVHSLSLPM